MWLLCGVVVGEVVGVSLVVCVGFEIAVVEFVVGVVHGVVHVHVVAFGVIRGLGHS